jgi:hypothetical protein
MISNLTNILSGVLDRLDLPEFAKPRWANAACKSIKFSMLSLILACCWASQSYAAENLECPEIGLGRIPDLIGDATGSGLVTTGNRVELVNEINYLINKMQISDPNISATDIQNVLIAAYCRVVARAPELTTSQKWSRMRQFDSVVEQQVAANTLAPGTVIIASVPLPADVYQELRSQAALSHQTMAQLMAAILARAAGR